SLWGSRHFCGKNVSAVTQWIQTVGPHYALLRGGQPHGFSCHRISMSFFERFCATLETAPVQAVFYGELAPQAAEAQRWTWLRSKRPGEPAVEAEAQVFALREGELSDEAAAAMLQALADRHGLGQADTLCGWFSGLADTETERGVLVLFKRGDAVTAHLQSWVCAQTMLAIRNDLLLQSERH